MFLTLCLPLLLFTSGIPLSAKFCFDPYPFCEVPSLQSPILTHVLHFLSSPQLHSSLSLPSFVFLSNYMSTVQNFFPISPSAGSSHSLLYSSPTLIWPRCQSPCFHISQDFCSVSSPASTPLTALPPMMGVHSSNLISSCLSWEWKWSKKRVKDVYRAQTERSEEGASSNEETEGRG